MVTEKTADELTSRELHDALLSTNRVLPVSTLTVEVRGGVWSWIVVGTDDQRYGLAVEIGAARPAAYWIGVVADHIELVAERLIAKGAMTLSMCRRA